MKVFVALLVAAACATASPVVTPSLQQVLTAQGTADIMIVMKEKTATVLAQVETQNFVNTNAKVNHLYKELNKFTAASQKEVLATLSKFKNAKVKPFYITNRISVRGATQELVLSLVNREDIEEIREAKVIPVGRVIETEEKQGRALEWGVSQINAPEAWELGITGEGIIVSNIDTGVRYTHVALRDGYRTEYGWYDPYQGTATPNDQNGHGTHTMGSITGRNGTGVAPGAQWVACKGCNSASCTEEALIGCGEWTLCPTLPDGTSENCDMRPHISSNSWGGGNQDPFYDDVISTWNTAGILPIFAIGNSGPGCRSANSPGDRPGVISVGATNNADDVAVFSSHGPTLDGNTIKPEVSAPGVNVRSCGYLTDNAYSILSGTSMATPHVAGAAALLLESGLTTRDEVAVALQDTAVRKTLDSIVCTGGGVDPTDPWPNNSYGWGRIDVLAAVANKKH